MAFRVGMTMYDNGCKCTKKDMSNQVTMSVVSNTINSLGSSNDSKCDNYYYRKGGSCSQFGNDADDDDNDTCDYDEGCLCEYVEDGSYGHMYPVNEDAASKLENAMFCPSPQGDTSSTPYFVPCKLDDKKTCKGDFKYK